MNFADIVTGIFKTRNKDYDAVKAKVLSVKSKAQVLQAIRDLPYDLPLDDSINYRLLAVFLLWQRIFNINIDGAIHRICKNIKLGSQARLRAAGILTDAIKKTPVSNKFGYRQSSKIEALGLLLAADSNKIFDSLMDKANNVKPEIKPAPLPSQQVQVEPLIENKIITVSVTKEMIEKAIKNSIEKGTKDVVGFLGTEIVKNYLGSIDDTLGFNTMYNGIKIDIKTKQCASIPLPHEQSVDDFSINQDCNVYVFCRIAENRRTGWLLGYTDKDDALNIRIDALKDIKLLKATANTLKYSCNYINVGDVQNFSTLLQGTI